MDRKNRDHRLCLDLRRGKKMKKYLLGLDVGTSSLKTAIIDEDGNVVSKSARGYEPMSLYPGWQEISAESIWAAVIWNLKKLK